MREQPIKKHPLVSSASHNGVLLYTTSVYLVSLGYEISLPHPSPYHTSQQADELVFVVYINYLFFRKSFRFYDMFFNTNKTQRNC